jgi:hypothetical protein
MYIPKKINASIATSKEDVATLVNNKRLAIHIPADAVETVFDYVKKTSDKNTSDRKLGKTLTVMGSFASIAAISIASIGGLIAAPIVAVMGIIGWVSSIDGLNEYSIAFLDDESILLLRVNAISFGNDTFESQLINIIL